MVTNELIEDIREKFREGKRRNEIKEELMSQGIAEEDIDAAISKMQHDLVKQLPGISWIYRHIEHLESKDTLKTPKMTLFLMIACVVFLFLFAGIVYFAFDPLGTRVEARDVQRQADAVALQNALNAYYEKNQYYPSTLDKLVPSFILTVPHDPQSGTSYAYQVIDDGGNYALCISFETQQQRCFNAAPSTSSIPVVPTATPMVQFVPQSASNSGGTNAL